MVQPTTCMDATAHYRALVRSGRKAFLEASAPALLFRHVLHMWPPENPVAAPITEILNEDATTANDSTSHSLEALDFVEVYPLEKKPGAPFPELILVGRSNRNDVQLGKDTVSKMHLYLTVREQQWWVADCGSKNGSWIGGMRLPKEQEVQIESRSRMRVGELLLTFYLAHDAYEALGGR
jgi:FHA domain